MSSKPGSLLRSLLATAVFFGVAGPAAAACVTGGSSEVQVQAKLGEHGAGALSAQTSCLADGTDGLWRATQPMAQADLRFEFAGYAPQNSFGIYDPLGSAMLEIFSGSAAPNTSLMLSYVLTGSGATFRVLGDASAPQGVSFTSNLFGFYLQSPDGLFRSETSANADGDHMVAFRLPYFLDRYLLGWEDLQLDDSDGDFNDMGVIVSNVAPVPLPAAAWLLLSGLAGVGALARRRRQVAPV